MADKNTKEQLLKLLQLYDELIAAVAGSYTRSRLARKIAAVFFNHFTIEVFTVGWCEELEQAAAIEVRVKNDQYVLIEKVHKLKNSKMAIAIESKQPYLATKIVILPLISENKRGFAILSFCKKRDNTFSSENWLKIAQILLLGHQNCHFIEKVARSSRDAHKANLHLRKELDEHFQAGQIIARSEVMCEVISRAKQVAGLPSSVFLHGESGTGKEVLARYIHRLSNRSHKAFVAINCGAIPENLVEAELFGFARGAFTSAYQRRVGYLQQANGGTLFLDEIGELSLAAQVKLLRFLEEGIVQPLGASASVNVDTRIIAATHRPIEKMVASGQFREDLYYRLHVFPLYLPPLRDRKEDIPVLAHKFVQEITHRFAICEIDISPQNLQQLISYSWPGNVRQLANILEQAIILSKDNQLELAQVLPIESQNNPAAKKKLQQTVRECIEKALTKTSGKIHGKDGAAHYLGLKPSTLQSKMKKLQIRREDFK